MIFFPITLLATNDVTVELSGFTKLVKNVRYYFVLSKGADLAERTVGHYTRTECLSCSKRRDANNLCITEIDGNFNASLSLGKIGDFVIIMYDPSRLYDYGMLLENESDSQKFNCFTMLSKWLAETRNVQKHIQASEIIVLQRLSTFFLIILNTFIKSFDSKYVQMTILRLTLFKHILGVIKNYVWLVENFAYNKRITSKTRAVNYLISCICDALFGITVLYLLNTTFLSSNELFSFVSNISYVNTFIQIYQEKYNTVVIIIFSK